MRWGLIPFWAKDATMGLSTVNGTAETVATAPAFREAFKIRRSLVPADAFYEWQKIDAKTKQPFAIAMKDGSPHADATERSPFLPLLRRGAGRRQRPGTRS
jgi:putative SOS response-associated peptidase YedK